MFPALAVPPEVNIIRGMAHSVHLSFTARAPLGKPGRSCWRREFLRPREFQESGALPMPLMSPWPKAHSSKSADIRTPEEKTWPKAKCAATENSANRRKTKSQRQHPRHLALRSSLRPDTLGVSARNSTAAAIKANVIAKEHDTRSFFEEPMPNYTILKSARRSSALRPKKPDPIPKSF